MSTKGRAKYEYELSFGSPRHQWSIVGAKGGVHLTITDYGEKHGERYGSRFSGGIECHWRQPPEYMQDQPPSHDECWLLKCPCWHDGSSSQAEEFWIPRWLAAPNDHDSMFELLEGDMRERLEQVDEVLERAEQP